MKNHATSHQEALRAYKNIIPVVNDPPALKGADLLQKISAIIETLAADDLPQVYDALIQIQTARAGGYPFGWVWPSQDIDPETRTKLAAATPEQRIEIEKIIQAVEVLDGAAAYRPGDQDPEPVVPGTDEDPCDEMSVYKIELVADACAVVIVGQLDHSV